MEGVVAKFTLRLSLGDLREKPCMHCSSNNLLLSTYHNGKWEESMWKYFFT